MNETNETWKSLAQAITQLESHIHSKSRDPREQAATKPSHPQQALGVA
jgi:hypothetical protein